MLENQYWRDPQFLDDLVAVVASLQESLSHETKQHSDPAAWACLADCSSDLGHHCSAVVEELAHTEHERYGPHLSCEPPCFRVQGEYNGHNVGYKVQSRCRDVILVGRLLRCSCCAHCRCGTVHTFTGMSTSTVPYVIGHRSSHEICPPIARQFPPILYLKYSSRPNRIHRPLPFCPSTSLRWSLRIPYE